MIEDMIALKKAMKDFWKWTEKKYIEWLEAEGLNQFQEWLKKQK